MSAVWRVLFAMLCFSVCVNAQTRTLAVFHSSAEHIDTTTVHELQLEVQRLLAAADFNVVWRQTQDARTGDQFDKIAVASFNGECSATRLAGQVSAAGDSVLGETDVDRHWRVQPFFQIDCNQIVRSLTKSIDMLSVPMRNIALGRALGRVIAHELYHILAQTTEHAEAGVAKASFSVQDLLDRNFSFNSASLERLLTALPRPVRITRGGTR